MLKELKRCTGHCCKEFTLPYSPKELRVKYKREFEDRLRDPTQAPNNEIRQIALMIKYLGITNTTMDGRKLSKYSEWIYKYTCRNYNPKSGDCRNYENRPRMCSEYPYGKKCLYPGCTLVVEGESSKF